MNNPLYDVLTPRTRQLVYAGAFVVLLVLSCIQAADGDWLQAVLLFASTLLPATAASNVPATGGEHRGTPQA